ncbi:hypothetical protein J4226_03820 [Candidatus Pacearchaeota archaeon]|nr:hypothetical protein [Candidatus Pacearchaeota archaeon]
MVIRRSGVALLGLLVGLFLIVASWPYLSYLADSPANGLTGNSIREAVNIFYETSSINQRIFILSQVLLLLIIIVAAFFIVRRFRKKEILSKGDYLIKDGTRRSRTDLDILYEMLKKKKEIDLEDIEGVFRVDPEVALGWAKVFENGDLAEIDYPRFGKPVLRLLEKKKEGEEIIDYAKKKEEVIVKKMLMIVNEKVKGKESGAKKKVTKKKIVHRMKKKR